MSDTITSGTVAFPQTCQWCGCYHTGICPMATAVEYYPDGRIKRVEFGQRQTVCPGQWDTYEWNNANFRYRAETEATP